MGGLSQGADSMPDRGEASAQALAQQLSQLKGANPGMMTQQIQQMIHMAASMIPQSIHSAPGVAQYMAKTLSGLRGALEAAQKAAMAEQSAAGPLQMSALGNDNSGGM